VKDGDFVEASEEESMKGTVRGLDCSLVFLVVRRGEGKKRLVSDPGKEKKGGLEREGKTSEFSTPHSTK